MPKKTEPTEPLTPERAILDLISALGFDPAEIATVEITPRHTRIFRKDRSLRSLRIDWQPKEENV